MTVSGFVLVTHYGVNSTRNLSRRPYQPVISTVWAACLTEDLNSAPNYPEIFLGIRNPSELGCIFIYFEAHYV